MRSKFVQIFVFQGRNLSKYFYFLGQHFGVKSKLVQILVFQVKIVQFLGQKMIAVLIIDVIDMGNDANGGLGRRNGQCQNRRPRMRRQP